MIPAIAAGVCAPGCGAVVAAIGGGPLLGGLTVAAALGYGIYTSLTRNKEEEFEDAQEEPEPRRIVVTVSRYDGSGDEGRKGGDSSSFL